MGPAIAERTDAVAPSWLDRAIGFLVPERGLQRMRARVATTMLARHYEAASNGRRTQNWRRTIGDANATVGPALAKLREHARDLVRNNPYAESALSTIADHAVGWGIVASEEDAHAAWKEWAGSTACDAEGRHDLAGLQKLVMRTVVESGEVIVRRLWRRLEDGLPLPFQIQVLEPDFLDTRKDSALPDGGRVVQGVEFDARGQRVAYWLFKEHPGSMLLGRVGAFTSVRVPATDVLHVFKHGRPGQVRGPSWFAPVLLRFKEFDEYEDAQLMKQKIAACLAVITSDANGSAPPLGTKDDGQAPAVDSLEPGMILNIAPGRTVEVVQPPRVGEYADYAEITLRSIATGLGVTYEDLTGDYTDLPFSAARMSRLRHWARVEDWRWRILVPQLLNPLWGWAMQASEVMGLPVLPKTEWTAPPLPMIEPDKEGLATQRNIRTGITTLSEAIRERGYRPAKFLAELSDDFKKLDELGLVLDCDPRKVSQAGLTQGRPQGTVLVDPTFPPPEPDPAKPAAGGAPAGGVEDETDGAEEDDAERAAAPRKPRRKRIDVEYNAQGRRSGYVVTEEN
jgi:lambda family phage portal protein